jgi:hypothetical protein
MVLQDSSKIDNFCKKNRQNGGGAYHGIHGHQIMSNRKMNESDPTATPPKCHAITHSKLVTTFIYSLQSSPKDVIIVQFHSAVKKIDELLFSKSFHLRSVELREGLVD